MDKIKEIRKLREKGLSFEEAYRKVMGKEVSEGYKQKYGSKRKQKTNRQRR